jgi:GGDEF domain-containing protein
LSTMMTDDHGSANGAHGGVGHLLRMAKTQCGGSLAFAALRKADGGFAIATFPTLTADPTWTVEAIDELVRQTWDDPNLTGGSVLVRSGRALRGMWTGQGLHIKLAVAALSDPGTPEHPWGLLCVAEPPAGHFEQDQLNLLANLAVRLTSYLRARQRVLEGPLSFEAERPVAGEPASVTEQAPPATPVPSLFAEPELDEPFAPAPGPAEEFEELISLAEDEEHPLDQAAAITEPESDWGAETRAPKVDDWEFLGLDEVEWVEAVIPGPVPTGVAPAGPEPAPQPDDTEAPPPVDWPTARTSDLFPGGAAFTAGGIDALLAPDAETGLATLTTLVGRLSGSLANVANNEGTVGLILFEVSPAAGDSELTPTALMTVAGRLTNHLRDRDLVARIGPGLFAILIDLRPGSIELEAILTRTQSALTAGVESSTGGLAVRSALVSAETGSTVSAETLLRQAADLLLGR